MESNRIYLWMLAPVMLTSFVSARAVNISNTWMLPEEGFPVFYRYFRDRISWYEADAVCQFHHANLVTAESTSQYDAIRAYLKELDITENVWIGLSKTTLKAGFTWTNFHPLTGDGHWQLPVPQGSEPVCVSMDPVADFLWKPMTCGGPEVASFICELPVPSWAIGPNGCLLTELPSLTVLYIPEQLALELTSDCGLDGTKRIACKGNADREEILKQLTCAIPSDDFDDKSTKPTVLSNTASSTVSDMSPEYVSSNSKTTKPWIWTSNTVDIDYGMPTRHRRETEDTLSPSSTKSTTDLLTPESDINNKLTTLLSVSSDDTKTTSFSPEDVMIDSIDSLRPLKSTELKTTTSTTQNNNIQTEEQAEMSGNTVTTADSKVMDLNMQDTGEYSSAIGQGQLFSIVENGTMFDTIEANETSDDVELAKDIMMETPQLEVEMLGASTDQINGNLYTTVVYHKEPPSDINFVTNKSVKKSEKHLKKHMLKYKDPKKVIQQIGDKSSLNKNNVDKSEYDKTLSKEVEMLPVAADASVRLNRTYRKEVPGSERENRAEMRNFDVSLNSTSIETDREKHHHVEIKWQDKKHEDATQMKLFITTKRISFNEEPFLNTKENIQPTNATENDQTHLEKMNDKTDLSSNNSVIDDNKTEVVGMAKLEQVEAVSEESLLGKEQFLPNSLIGETLTKFEATSESPSSNEPLEPEPQVQPRPNRQRQLTRPQRRSFYPYFFSRVLG